MGYMEKPGCTWGRNGFLFAALQKDKNNESSATTNGAKLLEQ